MWFHRFTTVVGMISAIAAGLAQTLNANQNLVSALAAVSLFAMWVALESIYSNLQKLKKKSETSLGKIEITLTALSSIIPRSAVLQSIQYSRGAPRLEEVEQMNRLIAKYANKNSVEVGDDDRLSKIKYPIELMESVSDTEDLIILSELLKTLTHKCCTNLSNDIGFNIISGLFTSNQVICWELAKHYKCGFLLVNSGRHVFGSQDIFGNANGNGKSIFVHDVIFTGERVIRAISILRENNIEVKHVIALIERTDNGSGARKKLQSIGVTLHALRKIDADGVKKILQDYSGTE